MNSVSIPNELLLAETARLIDEGYTVTHVVRGNSMNPFLVDRRDKVTLAGFAGDELKRGAFVLARTTDGRLVLHRITARRGDVLTLMGDGNVAATEQATLPDVIGIVTDVNRNGRIYRCTGRVWRLYSAVWMGLRPVRRYALGIWRRLNLNNTRPT